MDSQFVPGAILYSIKSLPDVIAELEDVAKTAISNDVTYQKLVSSLLAWPQLHQHPSAAKAVFSHAHNSTSRPVQHQQLNSLALLSAQMPDLRIAERGLTQSAWCRTPHMHKSSRC